MKEKLVSLIVPCYNGEKYLGRFLDSVLEQTYSNIQLILVNDGSTDNTSKIIGEYEPQLRDALSDIVLLEQKNAGAAAAVNYALKYVEGEYLSWADSDDILLADNIKKKFDYLEKNRDKGLVLGRAIAVDEETGKGLSLLEYDVNSGNGLFEDLIISGIPCYPGVFMVRTELLFRHWTKREIPYNREVGQNWQLLLPVAYSNECGYICDYIYIYEVRMNSHSHQVGRDYHRILNRLEIQEKILNSILTFMTPTDRESLELKIQQKYLEQKLIINLNLGDVKQAVKYKHDMEQLHIPLRKKICLKIMVMKIPGAKKMLTLLKK